MQYSDTATKMIERITGFKSNCQIRTIFSYRAESDIQ